jgi:predicted ATPase
MSWNETYVEYLDKCPRERWIGLQNFQGIRAYTKIPLAPITLLYGQNSAGKSSVHDAFHFITQFFSGNWDHSQTTEYLDRWANNKRITHPLDKDFFGEPEDVIIACGGFFSTIKLLDYNSLIGLQDDIHDVVAFDDLYCIDSPIHGDECNMPMSIRLHFSYSDIGWHLKEFVNYIGEDIFLHYKFFGGNFDNTFFGDRVQVEERSGMGNEPGRGPSDSNLFDSCLAFNIKHPAFYNLNAAYDFELSTILNTGMFVGYPIVNEDWLILDRLGLLCKFPSGTTSKPSLQWKNIINWYDYAEFASEISITNFKYHLRFTIDYLIAFPAYAVTTDIPLISIPPIREIPSKENAIFRLGKVNSNVTSFYTLAELIKITVLDKISIPSEKKYEGIEKSLVELSILFEKISRKGCPHDSNENPLAQVNRLLTSSLFLDTGYEIIGDCKFIIPENVIYKLADVSKEELRAILEQLEAEVHLRLRYIPDDLLLEIEDVGVGISQVIPVLLAANSARVYIQQPELHLHPRLQAQLADVFVEQVSRAPIFVIETHSEHFLLRILRRIRETYRSDITHTLFSLKAEDVVVLYVDKTKEGASNIVQLRISSDGEFIDRWPNGFFTERDGELFDE